MHSLPISEFITSGFYFSIFLTIASVILLVAIYFFRWKSDLISLLLWGCAYLSAFWLALYWDANPTALVFAVGFNVLLGALCWRLISVISVFGVFFFVSLLAPALYGLLWIFQLVFSLQDYFNMGWSLSLPFYGLAMALSFFMTLSTLQGGCINLLRFSELYFRFPRRSTSLKAASNSKTYRPWVSFHVPCYSEPPHLVIKTLDALSQIQYPYFEVVVLDNNTKDSELWKPVEAHCKKLGSRFRFFHFDNLKGAKAGALNKALSLTSSQIEIISVIDADYIAQPDFLQRLIPLFNFPNVAFIQTSHDYRNWENNPYQSGCYFEYQAHFKLDMPALSEWDAAYTIGTMCLFRRKALEESGGWSEWCLTEDSEITVRLHSLGYCGYYFKDTFGKGLIPETFEEYKKQRFRWSAGPVQQFKRHWRLYLPWKSASRLTFVQKLTEFFHSLSGTFSEILNLFIFMPVFLATIWFAVIDHRTFIVPRAILLFIPILIIKNLIFSLLRTRLLKGSFSDWFYSTLASRALIYTSRTAAIRAWFSHLEWKRTNKFKADPSIYRAFASSRTELILGIVYLLAIISLLAYASFNPPDLLFLSLLGLLNQAANLFCAPLMAFLSERYLSTSEDKANSSTSESTITNSFLSLKIKPK